MMHIRQPPGNPKWGDVVAACGAMFPAVAESRGTRLCRVELAEHDGATLPVVIVRSIQGFRTMLTSNTPAAVRVDLVTMFPFPTPFAYVMTVILDDEEDPYWAETDLNLFPVCTAYGAPILRRVDSDHLASRTILRAFCSTPPRCGLLVLDGRDRCLKSAILSVTALAGGRAREIADVLTFLDRFSITKDLAEIQLPLRLFAELACVPVEVRLGEIEYIPRGRSPLVAKDLVLSLIVSHGRLIDRAVDQISPRVVDKPADVFLSHAHADDAWAAEIRAWLLRLWPVSTVFMTTREDARANGDAIRFISELNSARCILYLVTPASLRRRMVDVEIAGVAGRPLLTVLVGGVTRAQVETVLADNLFLQPPLNSIVEVRDQVDWIEVGRTIASITGLARPTVDVVPPPRFAAAEAALATDDIDSYLTGYLQGLERSRQRQTPADALEVLVELQRGTLDQVAANGGVTLERMPIQSPRMRLLLILMTEASESWWLPILQLVPALVDEQLLSNVRTVRERARSSGDAALTRRLERIGSLIERMLTVG